MVLNLVLAAVSGGACGLVAAGVLLGLYHLSQKGKDEREAASPEPAVVAPPAPPPRPLGSPKVVKLGAASPLAARSEPPTQPTEPRLALDPEAIEAARRAANDETWDDGEPLTKVRTRPEYVDLETLTGKVVLTSGAAVLIEDVSGRRNWTAPRVHADVAPSIWLDEWGPLKPDELLLFAKHYRKVDKVQFEAPERLPTLLQELGYSDVGEWFRVYNTFLKHYGVGGPGDTIADYAFGQDFKDALFAAEF